MKKAFALRAGVLALCCISVVLEGCNPVKVDLALSSLKKVRLNAANEWRDTRRADLEGQRTVSLGSIPDGGWLRLGVRDAGFREAPVHVTVHAGGKRVARHTTGGDAGWHDWHIAFPPGNAGAECTVTFQSDQIFWISHCDLEAPVPDRTNVLVYLIDTLRADHLGAYGYERATSPNIDAFAADAIRFDNPVPQSSWTRPAVASLLSSTYPATHGANDRSQIMNGDLDSLGGALAAAGYETQAFMSNPSCTPYWGIGKEFQRFVDVDSVTVEPDKDERVIDAVLQSLESLREKPWFLYVHTIAPHNPYEAPAPFGGTFSAGTYSGTAEEQERAQVVDAYDEEIAYTDAQFGRLLEYLRAAGQYDNTLIVLLSDHGEEFLEHGGWGHGTNLYQEQLSIPLLVKLPHQAEAGTSREDVVELVDVAPTVLHLLGLPVPPKFEGNIILPENQRDSPYAFASLRLEKRSMRMARDSAYKVIQDAVAAQEESFDLQADMGETSPLDPGLAVLQPLRHHVERTSSMGAPGLHVLITGSLDDGRTFRGSIDGEDFGTPSLHYDALNASLEASPSSVSFAVALSPGEGAPGGLSAWSGVYATQNHAHLLIPCAAQPLRVALDLEGQPVPQELVFSPLEDSTPLVAGSPVNARQLRSNTRYDPAVLPERVAVYVWYADSAAEIEDDQVDDEMWNALEALGYIE